MNTTEILEALVAAGNPHAAEQLARWQAWLAKNKAQAALSRRLGIGKKGGAR